MVRHWLHVAAPCLPRASFHFYMKQFLCLARYTVQSPTPTMSRACMQGFYNSHLRKLGWSSHDLVQQANNWICSVSEVVHARVGVEERDGGCVVVVRRHQLLLFPLLLRLCCYDL
jgi:hypothetical protein